MVSENHDVLNMAIFVYHTIKYTSRVVSVRCGTIQEIQTIQYNRSVWCSISTKPKQGRITTKGSMGPRVCCSFTGSRENLGKNSMGMKQNLYATFFCDSHLVFLKLYCKYVTFAF